MSELTQIWAVKDQGLWQKCPKYGILVTGCSKYLECEGCIGVVKRVKHVKVKKTVKRSKRKPTSKRTKKTKTIHKNTRKTIRKRTSGLKARKFGGRHAR